MPVFADFRPECLAFSLLNQSHGHTGQPAFPAVLSPVVVPVGIYVAFHGTGFDHTDIHPGDLRTQFHGEGHGIAFPARTVQDDVALPEFGKGISRHRVHTQAVFSRRHVRQLIYAAGSGLVIHNRIALRVHQLHDKGTGYLFIAVACAGEVVVIVYGTLDGCRINRANGDFPCFRIAELEITPEVLPASVTAFEMVALRFIPGNGIGAAVIRKQGAKPVCIGAHTGHFKPAVCPGCGACNFASVPFLDRRDFHALQRLLTLVIESVVVRIQVADALDDAGPGKTDILAFPAGLVIQVHGFACLENAVPGDNGTVFAGIGLPGKGQPVRRIHRQGIQGGAHPVNHPGAVRFGNRLIMQAVFLPVQRNPHVGHHRLAAFIHTVHIGFHPAEAGHMVCGFHSDSLLGFHPRGNSELAACLAAFRGKLVCVQVGLPFPAVSSKRLAFSQVGFRTVSAGRHIFKNHHAVRAGHAAGNSAFPAQQVNVDAGNAVFIRRFVPVPVPVLENHYPNAARIVSGLQRGKHRFRSRSRLGQRFRDYIGFHHRRIGYIRLFPVRFFPGFPGFIRIFPIRFRSLLSCRFRGGRRCRNRRFGCCRSICQPVKDHRHCYAAAVLNGNVLIGVPQVPSRLKETGHGFNMDPCAFRQGDGFACLDLSDFLSVLPYTEPAVQFHIFTGCIRLTAHINVQRYRFGQGCLRRPGQQQDAKQDGKKSSRILHVPFSLRKTDTARFSMFRKSAPHHHCRIWIPQLVFFIVLRTLLYTPSAKLSAILRG